MSYDPQSGGNTEPTGESARAETPGGQPTMPTGGYTPPPSGGYTPPPAGGYTPPPPSSSAPPPGGGYTPPPPPPGGGYGAPPPPPQRTASAGGMGGMDQAGLQNLFQSYINAVTKPNAATYEAEIPNASMTKTLIGLAAVAIVKFILALVGIGASAAYMSQLTSQLRSQGTNVPDLGGFAGGVGIGSAVVGAIGVFITFFLGTGIQYMVARMQGGQGADFQTQSYLSSLSYVPLSIVASVLNIIPFVGLIGILISLYQIYSVGLSLQASQRLPAGKAQLAAWVPAIIYIVLACLCVVAAIVGVAALVGGANNP